MLKKYASLLLAAGLAFTLAACSPADEEQLPEDGAPSVSEPQNDQTPSGGTTAPSEDQPTADLPAGGDQNDQTNSNDPAAGQQPDSQPEGSSDPDAGKPSEPAPSTPQTPSEPAPPSEPAAPDTPPSADETTDDTENAADFTIDDIWADIQTALGDSLPSLSRLDDEIVTVLYPLSTGDLTEYGCYGSLMNVQASEFFIAKVQSGRMDAVKEALLSRQSDLEAQWRQYLPAQYELVTNYQLVQNGDYVFFGIAENVSAAVDVFNQYTK